MDLIELPESTNTLHPDVIAKLQNELVFTDGVESAVPLTLVERVICEMRADKKTNSVIASELGLSITVIKRVLAKEYVKAFLKDLINAQYDLTKEYRLEIMDKIIKSKMEQVERDLEGDFSKATRKDLVDLLLIQDSMLKEREKKELGTNEDTYITLLQQIVKK